ncbi:glycoside hydrolase family 63 protein [Amniculicola lignicola CBS 123094]|uniref:Mannosyl-oligosaccharide glucosidase n=1 Tax=Amniculicola lignicola CBS 123094 TaxID=1392246 RepID=A0A6A5WPR7_9PLEO|nr:glycoside hydrolase family 63 protein [Amniculicola lignicola CBS 123094]
MHLPTPLVPLVLAILAPALTAAESLASNNASLLWGTYRPNVYLGIRPRVPESVLMGLMWGKLGEDEHHLRHTCEQNDDISYGWTTYDARSGGSQTINDTRNQLDLTTEFLKKHEGQSAGNWGLRIRGTAQENAPTGLKTSVVFYVGMEEVEGCKACRVEATVNKNGEGDDLAVETVDIRLKHPRLGGAVIHISKPKAFNQREGVRNVHLDTSVKSINTTEDMHWQAKKSFLSVQELSVIPNEPGVGNLHFVQVTLHGGFEFEVLYSSQAATVAMTSSDLNKGLRNNVQKFNHAFASIMLPTAPFNSSSHLIFAQSIFSDLLSGLSYFTGDSKVDKSHSPAYDEKEPQFWDKAAEARTNAKVESTGPSRLFTHVPSRSVFPRGFLWDEGFHLLPILEWDADLALEVVRSWLALMDNDGWIAREQILGTEARERVPEGFQVQYPHIANPPTLFWIVSKYIDILNEKTEYLGHDSLYVSHVNSSNTLLEEIYPLLKRHYHWFRRTQSGDVEAHSIPQASLDEGYRWRGRTPGSNYASGLDDYPRAEPPDPSELHVDALCWVGVMAEALDKIAGYVGDTTDNATFKIHHTLITQNIELVHWSENEQTYCDAHVWESSHWYVCQKGYISLFPFLTGFIGAKHPHLNATLDLITDPGHLWTPYGIRSLSPVSTDYGTGGNYWKSPIWININYLIIERLLDLATQSGPFQHRCQNIYRNLRKNVVENVHKNWQDTGFAWEQYNADTGVGQRTQGFTGWTALVVKIMAFPDLEEKEEGIKEKVTELIQDARENHPTGAGGVIVAIMLLIFVYITRRRFAGLLRGTW